MRHSAIRLEHTSRAGAGRPGICPWAGQPDRRAHRLQRRPVPSVRDRARGHGRRRARRRGHEIEAHALDLAEPTASSSAPSGRRADGWRASCAARPPSCSGRDRAAALPARVRERPSSRRRAVLLGRRSRLALPRALRGQRRRAARPASSSPGSARASRTTGRARRPACSTSSPSLCAQAGHAVRIDMRGPRLRAGAARPRRPRARHARLGRLARALASSGYNERRAECRARLRAAGRRLAARRARSADGLPDPLDRRVRHVITENERVDAAVARARGGRPGRAGPAARRLAREPARRLRGLGPRGGARRRGMQATRARLARASWAAASADRCSPCSRRRPAAGRRGQGLARTSRAASDPRLSDTTARPWTAGSPTRTSAPG